MNFDITGKHIGAAMILGVLVGVLQYSCESQQKAEHQAEAEAEAEAVEWTPEQKLVHMNAQANVQAAHRAAMHAGMREVNRKLHVVERENQKKAPSGDQADVLTIVFSANNHGEREDCGCKNNPLGGLTRRQTLVELASKPTDEGTDKWWGSSLPAPDAVFNVDAGDLLFKSTTVDMHPEGSQKRAREHAKAVVAGLSAHTPDVVNVGEYDLVFGLDAYKDLVSGSGLPVVSANLYTKGGERPFDGHRVVSRDGKKVAFIGLLKPKSRVHDYYKKRELEVRDAHKAYVEELSKLPKDVDLVVMLSNLGINSTEELVEKLQGEGARVDAAIVSNTNRLTRSPVWADGTPLVEPLSRGKYFGRLDIILGDEPGVSFANAHEDPMEIVQRYRSAWSGYMSARDRLRDTEIKIAEMEKELAAQKERARETDEKLAAKEEKQGETGEKGEKGEAEKFVDSATAPTKSRIEYLEKKLPVLQKRVQATSESLAEIHAQIGSIDQLVSYGDGDDWATSRIVQVKLDIPQDKKVRRVLDRFGKGN